jgi:hypothetical protein
MGRALALGTMSWLSREVSKSIPYLSFSTEGLQAEARSGAAAAARAPFFKNERRFSISIKGFC